MEFETIDIDLGSMQHFVIGLGLITLEVHHMKYSKSWGEFDFYIDSWFGTLGHTLEYGSFDTNEKDPS